MAAYFVNNIEVHDPVRYADYAAIAGPSVPEHGGRYLVRGGAAETLEGDVVAHRVVVIEFDSREAAMAWYESPVYREARAIRAECSRGDWILVDGV